MDKNSSLDTLPNDGETISLFEVLSPFKVRGVIVKPPAWVEMTDTQARIYQDAGVLGTEPGIVPSASDANDDVSQNGSADAAAGEESLAGAADASDMSSSETELQAPQTGHSESQANDGGSDTTAATDQPGNAAAGGESLAGAAEAEALYGSSKFGAVLVIGGAEVQLGDIVAAAHAASGLAIADWNALAEVDRDTLLQAEIDARISESESIKAKAAAMTEPSKPTKSAKAKK